jgi:glycosyltransferase involved in cell wall biosynthesis
MKIAVVVPRYGPDVVGGAETLVRGLAERIQRGDAEIEVEALTTCARDHHTWKNYYREGRDVVNGVPVRRFAVNANRDLTRYGELLRKLSMGQLFPLDEQYEWIDVNVHSARLYDYIERNEDRYDYFLFAPYLFGTTYYGASIVPHKSIICPCLHDEPFAYFEATRLLLESCRGIMFNTEPEMRLARDQIGVRNAGMRVVGFGFDDPSRSDDLSRYYGSAHRFQQKYRKLKKKRFILYAGRLEEGKNVPLLLSYFRRYQESHKSDLKLVLMGSGMEKYPLPRHVIRLGIVPEEDKLDVYAAATVLCQPSVNESFSIVMMESWLMEVPVLVHDQCPVTKYHCLKSNGGLFFRDYDEFEASLSFMLDQPEMARRLGQNGRQYVLTNYSWEAVIRRFKNALREWATLR